MTTWGELEEVHAVDGHNLDIGDVPERLDKLRALGTVDDERAATRDDKLKVAHHLAENTVQTIAMET